LAVIGWYKDPSLTQPVTSADLIMGSARKNFYAKWGIPGTSSAQPKTNSTEPAAVISITNPKSSSKKLICGQKPQVTFTIPTATGSTVVPAADYSVDSGDYKQVGKHTLTITYQGKTYTQAYTVYPATTKITKITAARKALKVYWQAVKGGITNYRLAYKTGKGTWKYKTLSAKKPQAKLTHLKAKHTYTVKVLSYKAPVGKTIASKTVKRITKVSYTLKWKAYTGAECYRIYYKKAKGSWHYKTLKATLTSYKLTKLSMHQEYHFKV
jgi:hypothetical protein